jgi:hypothetical protein
MAKQSKTIIEEIQGTVDQIIAQIKRLVKEGNARRVIIKNKHGKTLFQSQLTIGAAGATFFMIYAPILSAITTLVLMANDVTVLVEREIDDEEDYEKDEYEVEAEVIEIRDDEEEDESDSDEGYEKSEK